MPHLADLFVYGVVNPICLVLAYRNLSGIQFGLNVLLWSLPATAANYLTIASRLSGWSALLATVALWSIFFACAYSGAFLHQWIGQSQDRDER